MWYNGSGDQQSATFDYTKRLSATSQELIGDAKWYLGGFESQSDRITNTMYTLERGTTVYSGRPTLWTGKVALIYPSDYGYATAGGTTTTRSDCIGTVTTFSWNLSSYSDCKNNDWLKPSSGCNWLLSPSSNSPIRAFLFANTGHVDGNLASTDYAVLPAVYLQSGVTISSGSGTESDPYVIS